MHLETHSHAGQKYLQNGPLTNHNNPFPHEYDFFFSARQKWGSCVTATAYEGHYTTSGHYTYKLQADKGLYLDIYSDNNQFQVRHDGLPGRLLTSDSTNSRKFHNECIQF